MPNSAVIHRVTALDLKAESWAWPFASERRAEISAHFLQKQREKPIWNGRILLARGVEISDETLTSRYFETDFADMLAWRDWGFPDRNVFNAFGMGALRSADGAFVLGEMGAHTANAGRVYFPSGTPDPNDVLDGTVDLVGSVDREMEEETGLRPADYSPSQHWDCVMMGPSVALFRTLAIDMSGEALKARIEANLARQAQPELSAIRLVRSVDDLSASMPRFVKVFLERELSK